MLPMLAANAPKVPLIMGQLEDTDPSKPWPTKNNSHDTETTKMYKRPYLQQKKQAFNIFFFYSSINDWKINAFLT